MKLNLEKRKRILDILKDVEMEEKESSIVFKTKEASDLVNLSIRGYINILESVRFMNLLKNYDAVVYGSILFEYEDNPVHIGAVKLFNPTLEDCKKLNNLFKIAMPYADGSVVWMGLK